MLSDIGKKRFASSIQIYGFEPFVPNRIILIPVCRNAINNMPVSPVSLIHLFGFVSSLLVRANSPNELCKQCGQHPSHMQ